VAQNRDCQIADGLIRNTQLDLENALIPPDGRGFFWRGDFPVFWYTCSVSIASTLAALLRSPSLRMLHNVSITASFAASHGSVNEILD
jgi:hypothetical protein